MCVSYAFLRLFLLFLTLQIEFLFKLFIAASNTTYYFTEQLPEQPFSRMKKLFSCSLFFDFDVDALPAIDRKLFKIVGLVPAFKSSHDCFYGV